MIPGLVFFCTFKGQKLLAVLPIDFATTKQNKSFPTQ